jgi:hypothetical protein
MELCGGLGGSVRLLLQRDNRALALAGQPIIRSRHGGVTDSAGSDF